MKKVRVNNLNQVKALIEEAYQSGDEKKYHYVKFVIDNDVEICWSTIDVGGYTLRFSSGADFYPFSSC